MLNKPFRNNGFVVSVGNGMGTSLFPCPVAGIWLRDGTVASGVNWWGCGNYGYNDTSVANYNYFTDGSCGEYAQLNGTWHRPAGDVLYDTGCCQVIWDGSSYYVNDNCNPCGQSGTPTGNTTTTNVETLYWSGCGNSGTFDYAYDIQEEFNDGNCSTYWMTTGHWEADDGSRIYEDPCCFIDYDYRGSYSVTDNCGEPPPPPCPPAGYNGGQRNTNFQSIDWSGCGTSGVFVYSYDIELWYDDGMCSGSYTYSETVSAQDGDIIYDNGCCVVTYSTTDGYIVTDNCNPPPPCPDAGTQIRYEENTRSSFDWYGCGAYGNFVYESEGNDYYADGSCGEYSSPTSYQASWPSEIYNMGCCIVVYYGYGNWQVEDNCQPCPTGPTGNYGSSSNTLDWSGCGTNGTYTYEEYYWSEENDGNCGTYYSYFQTWAASVGDYIYDGGCCKVVYTGAGGYNVDDTCGGGCTDSGTPTGNTTTTNHQSLSWNGCGNSGDFTYFYESGTEYHDGSCSTYWVYDNWSASDGDMIYDNGCCTVTYSQYGSYNVNDNCGEPPPPPDYPSAGTVLSSGSGDTTAQIVWGDLIGQSNSQEVITGSYSWQDIADGQGGSTYESWSSYFPDGTTLFQEPIGLELNLNWAVDVNGSPASGTIAWGQELGNWTLENGSPSRTSTSLVDIITDGYMIYESDSWWNGDANVKVQVIFQSGGLYLTNTITF